ncbi:hypothetical protein ACZ87_01350 [Candidatus Erwinia dacicola]|uniref:Uncharacterized protein n=1 Tax=Candidatus Erwinia dacicola TaxID=252393 RepID=A0A328TVL2_9GAMM|nr:hypothetical protein ACZ87_01350 [Candidatus Erwinia dacicola]
MAACAVGQRNEVLQIAIRYEAMLVKGQVLIHKSFNYLSMGKALPSHHYYL